MFKIHTMKAINFPLTFFSRTESLAFNLVGAEYRNMSSIRHPASGRGKWDILSRVENANHYESTLNPKIVIKLKFRC